MGILGFAGSVGNREGVGVSKHTPGKWIVWDGPLYEGGGADLCIGVGDDKWLANIDHRQGRCTQILEDGHFADECDICTIDSGKITEEQRANAYLIAAAPDLLEACKAALAKCPFPVGTVFIKRKLEDAISKAKEIG